MFEQRPTIPCPDGRPGCLVLHYGPKKEEPEMTLSDRVIVDYADHVKVLGDALKKAVGDMQWMFGAWDGSSPGEDEAAVLARANIKAAEDAYESVYGGSMYESDEQIQPSA